MGYRTYSDEFKREVLEMAAEGKRSIAQIERELDITAGCARGPGRGRHSSTAAPAST